MRALARIETDARIASILNKAGQRSAHGQAWTARLVCSLRNNHSIAVYKAGEREARGELSVAETAEMFGVTPTAILRLIRLKQLPAAQVCKNAPWILLKDDVEQVAEDRRRRTIAKTVNSNQLVLRIQ